MALFDIRKRKGVEQYCVSLRPRRKRRKSSRASGGAHLSLPAFSRAVLPTSIRPVANSPEETASFGPQPKPAKAEPKWPRPPD